MKQLLYVLTVAQDGAVPVYFTAASGNVTDDTTHRRTWDVLCELVGRRDFLYVADCKLATRENLGHIHRNGGRFSSVLPRTRKEDADFRRRMLREQVTWQSLLEKTDEEGNVVDRISICNEPHVTAEGYRLLWYHSTRKAELHAAARVGNGRSGFRVKMATSLAPRLDKSLTSSLQHSGCCFFYCLTYWLKLEAGIDLSGLRLSMPKGLADDRQTGSCSNLPTT